jgi:hypothetical protein
VPLNRFQQVVRTVSDQYDTDIILYIGAIDRPYDDTFIERVVTYKRRKNVLLILTTPGGDPNAAYRIARCLQAQYRTVEGSVLGAATPEEHGKFRIFVDTRCKSAGTILATGANAVLVSDYGELGPIDVQIRKGDEVGERSSVLTPMHALESLQQLASKHFEDSFKGLRFSAELAFSTKLASDIASKMAIGLFSQVYGQIDPMRIGEFDRAMRIAADYATRLGKGNLKDDALKKLVSGYPSHGFVIDKKEAAELFKTVEEPSADLITLGRITRNWWNDEYLSATATVPLILYLTTDDILTAEVKVDEQPEGADAAPADQ